MDTITQEQTGLDLDFPSLWGVQFLNDDFTPMDIVVAILMTNFALSFDDAEAVMLRVHNEGEAIVGAYPKDIAITKASKSEQQARNAGHPLRLTAVSV